MAHKKGLGSSRNGRDSNAKRLGVKVFAGQAVTGGFPYVGTKQLVRIEDVGRTSATAALVDAEPQVSEPGDALPSKAKRRGRRGGRRRSSRAKAETTGSE